MDDTTSRKSLSMQSVVAPLWVGGTAPPPRPLHTHTHTHTGVEGKWGPTYVALFLVLLHLKIVSARALSDSVHWVIQVWSIRHTELARQHQKYLPALSLSCQKFYWLFCWLYAHFITECCGRFYAPCISFHSSIHDHASYIICIYIYKRFLFLFSVFCF